MRNNALTICCGVCVAGAFGVFTRWIQNMTAFDDEGLYLPGSFWGWMLLLLYLAAAAVLIGTIWFLKNREGLVSSPSFSEAHGGGGQLRKPAYLAVAALYGLTVFGLPIRRLLIPLFGLPLANIWVKLAAYIGVPVMMLSWAGCLIVFRRLRMSAAACAQEKGKVLLP